jgi:hypothetical protein
VNGEILNAMARLGGQYAAMGIYAEQDELILPGQRYLCCDLHGWHCEPPGDLCCAGCTEASHDSFPIRHADGTRCVLDPPEET